MKKLFQKILSIIMSLLTYLGLSATIPEDNTKTIVEIASNYPYINYGINDEEYEQQWLDRRNQLPHDFLAGYYTNDGKEITITGLKARDFDLYSSIGYGYNFIDFEEEILRIPDEIDGIPVTEIDEGAFEHGFWGSLEGQKIKTYIIGNNVKTINGLSFTWYPTESGSSYSPSIIIGKNVEITGHEFNGCGTLYCYENSDAHKCSLSLSWFMFECFKDIVLIDESHLTSNVAKIDENGTVTGLPSGLTKEMVTDFLAVDGDASMEISDNVIGTGTVIELINSEYGTVDNTYTVIMDGDINGDGNVNTTDDVNAIRKIITGNDAQFTASHKKAADLNGDGIVNSTDLVLMKSMQN